MVKRIIAFCLLLLLSCTVVQAEPESRWKWYYSSERVGMYFDTQTLHYDASKSFYFWKRETLPMSNM